MKKIISIFLLFITLFSITIIPTKAENIDTNKLVNLEIIHQYGNTNIKDTNVSIYTIATLTENGTYEFQKNYQSISFNPIDMSSSEQNLKAKEILEYIKNNSLPATDIRKTNQDGITSFNNLVPGLYLIQIENKTINNYQYSVLPTLITVPTLENNIYQYNVKINTKPEQEEIKEEIIPEKSENINVPNTLDNIVFYIVLMGISLLVIIGVLYYISKINKKGKKSNEKNN